jgi:hypothetical protein
MAIWYAHDIIFPATGFATSVCLFFFVFLQSNLRLFAAHDVRGADPVALKRGFGEVGRPGAGVERDDNLAMEGVAKSW